MKNFMVLLLVCVMAMIGCATPGSFTASHRAADQYAVTNEKYVDTSPDIVWDALGVTHLLINKI